MEITTNKHLFKLSMLATALAFLCQNPASATNGYFSHGNGTVAKGMGGAATAMTEDTFGGANNPAAMVWVGNRFDAGVDWFQPSRSATRSGAAIASLNGTSESAMAATRLARPMCRSTSSRPAWFKTTIRLA